MSPDKNQAMIDLQILRDLTKTHTPINITCPKCGSHGTTVCTKQDSQLEWGSCFAIFAGTGPSFFCLIPFCIKSFKETRHNCMACGQLLGKGRACNGN